RIFWQFMNLIQDLNIETYTRTITKSCPNLRFVSIFVGKDSLCSLERILKCCNLLEGIDIQMNPGSDLTQTAPAIELLGRYAPKSLSTIVMDILNCEILPDTLDAFLEEWWGQKRKPLGLYINIGKLSQEVLDIIEQYKFKGIIKEFYYRDMTPFYEIDSIRK
ncbi:15176_t:CDS:1, partial [Acaulospora colombiana]